MNRRLRGNFSAGGKRGKQWGQFNKCDRRQESRRAAWIERKSRGRVAQVIVPVVVRGGIQEWRPWLSVGALGGHEGAVLRCDEGLRICDSHGLLKTSVDGVIDIGEEDCNEIRRLVVCVGAITWLNSGDFIVGLGFLENLKLLDLRAVVVSSDSKLLMPGGIERMRLGTVKCELVFVSGSRCRYILVKSIGKGAELFPPLSVRSVRVGSVDDLGKLCFRSRSEERVGRWKVKVLKVGVLSGSMVFEEGFRCRDIRLGKLNTATFGNAEFVVPRFVKRVVVDKFFGVMSFEEKSECRSVRVGGLSYRVS